MIIDKEEYLNQRLNELGITPELNQVIHTYNLETGKPLEEGEAPKRSKVFEADDEGNIRINYFHLTSGPAKVKRKGATGKSPYYITRLREPQGDRKYQIKPGMGTLPFIPPGLIQKYHLKQKIDTLILTEGAFKAFKGDMHGLDIIGFTSITHYKDRDRKDELSEDVKDVIKRCGVNKVVWLVDGDCTHMSAKALENGKDLYTRPLQFYSSAAKIKNLLEGFELQIFFMHPFSERYEGNPKGLDDILVHFKMRESEIVDDLLAFNQSPRYFHREEITFTPTRVRKYLKINDVNDFCSHHMEKHHDLKHKEFVFNGTRYKWDDEKSQCNVIMPGEAKNYFRVGDQYHEFVQIPNKYGQMEKTFHRRQKSTIVEDHGKKFTEHVAKYKAFCIVPDHLNFQQVIANCFNIYAPFDHEPEDGECPTIIEFIKHIFGEGVVKWKNSKTGQTHEYYEYDLGLDYIQLLYQKPTQILPILCLVSRENNTGKSTLAKLLKLIYTQNVAIVGNNDLNNDFNAYWASKLLIVVDEAKIDKHVVVERVKALSTADKISMNSKGKDQIELDFFGKFIFCTNNEENFIYATDDDVRYWVRKIHPIPANKLNVNMLQDMQDEIPAFLHFLNKRKMVTEDCHRAWFHPDLIKTEALKRVISHSAPTIEKELRQYIRDMFFDFGDDQILMTKDAIHREVFNKRFEKNYLDSILKEKLKVEPAHKLYYDEREYSTMEQLLESIGGITKLDPTKLKKKYLTKRHSYPRWDRTLASDGKTTEVKRVDVNENGRPYVFRIEQFLTPEEIGSIERDPETEYLRKMNENNQVHMDLDSNDDLPF